MVPAFFKRSIGEKVVNSARQHLKNAKPDLEKVLVAEIEYLGTKEKYPLERLSRVLKAATNVQLHYKLQSKGAGANKAALVKYLGSGEGSFGRQCLDVVNMLESEKVDEMRDVHINELRAKFIYLLHRLA